MGISTAIISPRLATAWMLNEIASVAPEVMIISLADTLVLVFLVKFAHVDLDYPAENSNSYTFLGSG